MSAFQRISKLCVCLALCAAVRASMLGAQQADVVRGRITGDDGRPIGGATVQVTSIPGNVARSARSDDAGRYTITFSGGEGDYWVVVSALGFTPRRFELKRLADEEILIGDARLARAAALLDAVKVRADRARAARNDNAPDPSGTEKTVSAATVDPAQAGNLAAMAAALPGVQLIPGDNGGADAFSVFGLGGDQNTTTLNGLGFGGADVPRDAAVRSALGTTPWDVSRGGFSGGQLGLRTLSGSNFSSRALSTVANAPALQWTDAAGRASGAEYDSFSLGAATSGPIAIDNSFYSAGYQLDRRSSALQSLTTASDLALRTAGVARDSVVRLRSVLANAGVPLSAARLPSARVNEKGSFLAAFDFAPPTSTSGASLNVTASGTFSRLSAPFGQVVSLPTVDAARTSWFGAVQARHTDYVGFGILTETSVGVSRSRAYTDPYLALPNGVVRVGSALDDATSAVSELSFGGSPLQSTTSSVSAASAQNQLSWFTADNRHRLKLTGELRVERYSQDLSMNRLGTYAYNSLADLAAGAPASFTRLLAPSVRGGSQISGGLSLGDSYRPTTDFQLQYGVRLDGNRYGAAPARNAALQQALDVDNSVVPDRVYVSPRVGFSWTYGQAAQLAIGDGFVRGPRAVVRGGIGVFQGTSSTQLTGGAIATTGLAGSVQQLTCVGDAVPTPDWAAYAAGTSAIPTQCANGIDGTRFASSAPNVQLISREYAAPRSVRANLNWSGALPGNRVAATIDGTYSLNRDQPGIADLNFSNAPRFALSNEGGRPVFVDPSSIVAETGAIALQGSRRAAGFAQVIEQRSDLESRSGQLLVMLAPIAFSSRFTWQLGYVYANTRDRASGFASTAGSPIANEWARSPFDSRHQVLYTFSYNVLDWVPVSWTGSFRSGRPFTPLVGGDVNGDGFTNDRAFVFDPGAAQDAGVADGMRRLLASGSSAARACLSAQLGTTAARNSCQSPWVTTSNLTLALNPLKFRLPQRMNLSLFVSNTFGAADLLLHGESRRRGWGQSTTPDQTLLFVRGFDPATKRFRYDVNPRFGSTSLAQTLDRNPVVVTAQVRLDVGFTRERQLLTQSLDKGRTRPGARSSDQDIKGLSAALMPANPMASILAQADSLALTRRQADSLARLNRAFTVRSDSIWTPVVKFLAELPPDYDRAEAYERFRRARESTVDMLLGVAPSIRSLLTPQQMRLLPSFVTTSLDTRYLASVRSSTAGGASLGILSLLAQVGATAGAADASGAQTIMIHK